jgi:Zn-dependent M32 family carboxypeptidase
MKKVKKILEELWQRGVELTNLNNTMALLQWDQEVIMPPAATKDRAGQLATLSSVIHKQITAPTLNRLLQEALSQILPVLSQRLFRHGLQLESRRIFICSFHFWKK